MLCNRTCLRGAVVLGLIATPTPSLWGDGGLTWFTDQAEFEAFNQAQGLFLSGIEDFEESILPPNQVDTFDDPLESFVPNTPGGFPFGCSNVHLPSRFGVGLQNLKRDRLLHSFIHSCFSLTSELLR